MQEQTTGLGWSHISWLKKLLQSKIASNRPPLVSDKEISITRNSEVKITLTGNDPDGDPIAYFIVSPPTSGTISRFDPLKGSIVYTANPDYVGLDSFTYKASDGIATSNQLGKVSIIITASPRHRPK